MSQSNPSALSNWMVLAVSSMAALIKACLPFRVVVRMLSLPLVRLQTGKPKPRSCVDLLSDFNRRFTGGDAASAGTDVDLDQALDGRAVFLCTSREIVHII